MSTKPPTDLTPSSETGEPTSKRRREGDESPPVSAFHAVVRRTRGQQPISGNHMPSCSKWMRWEQSEDPVGIKNVASLHQIMLANIVREWESAAREVEDNQNAVISNPMGLEAGVQGLATGGISAKHKTGVGKVVPMPPELFTLPGMMPAGLPPMGLGPMMIPPGATPHMPFPMPMAPGPNLTPEEMAQFAGGFPPMDHAASKMFDPLQSPNVQRMVNTQTGVGEVVAMPPEMFALPGMLPAGMPHMGSGTMMLPPGVTPHMPFPMLMPPGPNPTPAGIFPPMGHAPPNMFSLGGKYNPPEEYVCNWCDCICSRRVEDYIKWITDPGGKKFVCPFCGYMNDIKESIENHVLRHIRKQPFACPLCCYKINSYRL